MMIFRFFFSFRFVFLFLFPFLFFLFSFSFFCKTRTCLPRILRDKKGLFWYLTSSTLPYLTFYLPPYVTSLTSGTYQTSSQPPNLVYLPYPSAFRALLSPLTSWFGQSHRSNDSVPSSPIVLIDHIFQASLIISRTFEKNSILSPPSTQIELYLVPMVIHSPHEKQNF